MGEEIMTVGFQVLKGCTIFICSRHFSDGKALLRAKVVEVDSVGRGIWLETQFASDVLGNNGVNAVEGSKPPFLFLPFSEIDYVISFPLV
jgi:hypothetical protein